jgi:hypothetical protein
MGRGAEAGKARRARPANVYFRLPVNSQSLFFTLA